MEGSFSNLTNKQGTKQGTFFPIPGSLALFNVVQCSTSSLYCNTNSFKVRYLKVTSCDILFLYQIIFYAENIRCIQKYSRLRCLLNVKGLVFCFYLGWSDSILRFRQNMIKVRLKSWLHTCSSNITLNPYWLCFEEIAKVL